MSSHSPSQESDAWASLALKSAPASPSKLQVSPESKGAAIARLEGQEFVYMVRQKRIIIGRNSTLGEVDVDLGNSSFISRKHLEIFFDHPHFFMVCNSKNGVFVNGFFQGKGAPQLQLPKACTIRFPSANMRLVFQSLVDEEDPPLNVSPLPINIPDPGANFSSPFPPPTGTIRSDMLMDIQHSDNGCPPPIDEPPPKSVEISPLKDDLKPPYTYAQLIVQALAAAKDKQLILSGIYSYITKNYPYFRTVKNSWKNAIRHNLSLYHYFIKIPRSKEEPGKKGCFWRMDPLLETELIEQACRPRQKGVPCFQVLFGASSRVHKKKWKKRKQKRNYK